MAEYNIYHQQQQLNRKEFIAGLCILKRLVTSIGPVLSHQTYSLPSSNHRSTLWVTW